MQPISPVIPGFEKRETVFAKDQSEYSPLPALVMSYGEVVTRWRPTLRERLRIFFGGDIYLQVLTFNRPLQPVKLDTEPPFSVGGRWDAFVESLKAWRQIHFPRSKIQSD
jgi:hypothetical protein